MMRAPFGTPVRGNISGINTALLVVFKDGSTTSLESTILEFLISMKVQSLIFEVFLMSTTMRLRLIRN